MATLAVAGIFLLGSNHARGPSGNGAAAAAVDPAAAAMQSMAAVGYEPNLGQWDSEARFVFRNGLMTLLLEHDGWVVGLLPPTADQPAARHEKMEPAETTSAAAALRMTFEGAADHAEPVGDCRRAVRRSYFLGESCRWRADVPFFGAVHYRAMYPGVDVRLREVDGSPEYDLLLAPGADLDRVAVRVDGAVGLGLDRDGALVIDTAVGPVIQPLPYTWQVSRDGERRLVPCRYVLRGPDRFGFEVVGWDGLSPLTIDPGLHYSSALPGAISGPKPTRALVVSVDAAGVVTFAGVSQEPLFPTTMGAFSVTHSGMGDAYISRLDPSLTGAAQLVYSTFLGGAGGERVDDLVVDAAGVITAIGRSNSPVFPTTPGAFDETPNGRSDVFVARLDPSQVGTAQLLYGTMVGGANGDVASCLAVDANGVITFTGDTDSPAYPTTLDAYDAVYSGGTVQFPQDSVITRLDPSEVGAAQLVYSTYVGGTGFEYATGLFVDPSGVVTIGGETSSADLTITTGAFDSTYDGESDAFVVRLDPSQTGSAQLVYSTFLGGTSALGAGYDLIFTLDVDEFGLITVGGLTHCDDFPVTANAFSGVFNGGTMDAFIAQLDPGQTGAAQLVYSTYLGGGADEGIEKLLVSDGGVVEIVGSTGSGDFPTTAGAYDQTYNGGSADAFVARLNPQRSGAAQLIYSTFLGGNTATNLGGFDSAYGLFIDSLGMATVVGESDADDFPTTNNAYASPDAAGLDAFVTQLDRLPAGVHSFGASSPGCDGPLVIGVTSIPRIGNPDVAITCTNAPPLASGLILIGGQGLQKPISVLGVDLWVDPGGWFFVFENTQSDARGAAEFPFPLPFNLFWIGKLFHIQFVWVGAGAPSPCPPSQLSASNAIEMLIGGP